MNYAYSGLHSIIHPPPNEVDIWGSIIIPIFQLNRNLAECEFCFDNYAEDRCQFYRPSQGFLAEPTIRRGKLIYCECCDFSGDDEDGDVDCSNIENQLNINGNGNVMQTFNGCSTNPDNDIDNKRLKIADTETVTPKIQPGWYGKGETFVQSTIYRGIILLFFRSYYIRSTIVLKLISELLLRYFQIEKKKYELRRRRRLNSILVSFC